MASSRDIHKTQEEYARKLYRQQQLDMMESIAAGHDAVSLSGESYSRRSSVDSNAPEGTLESARRFLWDDEPGADGQLSTHEEDEDDDRMGDRSTMSSVCSVKSSRSTTSARGKWGSGIAKSIKKTIAPSSNKIYDMDDDSESNFYGRSDRRNLHNQRFDAQPRESYTESLSHESIKMSKTDCSNFFKNSFMCVYHTMVGLTAILCQLFTSCLSFGANPRFVCILLFVLFAFAGLGVSIVVLLDSPNGGSSSATNSNTNGGGGGSVNPHPSDLTPTQTFIPDDLPPIEDQGRYDELREVIADSRFTSEDKLDTLGSPQNYALRWLTDEDGRKISMLDPGMPQRYALATLYYSTYVYAESLNAHQGKERSPIIYSLYWTHMENWMSDHGICMWEGVVCEADGSGKVVYDGDGHVVALNLPDNNLRGVLPSELVALSGMETLILSNNFLSGNIPQELGDFVGSPMPLQTLDLAGNQLTGTLPIELGNLRTMTNLSMSKNEFSGTIPTEFEHMTNLRVIDFSENLLTGSIPEAFWSAWTKLESLLLSANELKGTLSSQIEKMVELVDFRMSGNSLTGSLPESIRELSKMKYMDLEYNLFGGSIPLDWGTLDSIEEIKLNGNKLTGSLPSSIHKLLNLRILDVNSNQMQGTLASVFGQMKSLTNVYLHSNKFEGSIPPEIGVWQAVTDLRLSNNKLTGTIPTQLAGMFSLEQFEGYGNALTGTIPSELGSLENLKTLKLHINDLSGPIPAELCELEKTDNLGYMSTDCNGDAGGQVVCDCCTACFPSGGGSGGGSVPHPSDVKPTQDSAPDDLPPIEDQGRYDELRGVIVDARFTSEDNLDLLGSPQNYALRWLTDEDSRKISVLDPGMPQRYALATLYFSTYVYSESLNAHQGKERSAVLYSLYWTNMENWMSNHGICMWEGVVCEADSSGKVVYDGDGHVVSLNLPDNNLHGVLPSELVALSRLEALILSNNLLSGSIPKELGDFIGSPMPLQTLDLSGNQLTGTLPIELGNLRTMTNLSMSKNEFSGTIPTELELMTDLRVVDFTENLLTGSIPEALWSAWTKLESLLLGANELKGTLSSQIEKMVELVDFRMSGNSLTGSLPESIRELSKMKYMDLEYNLFGGSIPLDWGTLESIEEIKLNGNKLTGSLPSSIHKLLNLRILDVNSNQMQGTLASVFGQMKSLTNVYLHSNKFEGSIPPEIGVWQAVTDLRLSNNKLTGTIPTQLAGMFSLEQFEGYGNALTGTIPSELGSLENLKTLKLHINDLSGPIPAELCELEKTDNLGYVSTDCNGDAGGQVVCDCCTACFPA